MTLVAMDAIADDRLHRLGLAQDVLARVLLRADAEAKMTTDLEPPTAEGTVRYIKTVGVLREELVPLGWDYDNSKNFCRTIHPSRAFSIVTSSGDEYTGVDTGKNPSTKYSKGDLTALAVQRNAGQEAFELGAEFDEPMIERAELENIWFLLQRPTADYIFAELSLPTQIEGGMIIEWEERIILPPLSRQDPTPTDEVVRADDGDGYSVEVAMR